MSTGAASEYHELYHGFDWRSAPLSDMRAPFVAGAGYVLLVVLLNSVMRRLGGFDTKRLQAAHNMVLCVGSLVMTLGTGLEVVRRSSVEGSSRWLFCEAPSTEPRGALWFWSYVYYLSKYYELLDTVLQLLKGRPPPHFTLHVYHHASVLVMSWGWVEYVQTLSFIGLLFNTSVHVVMYEEPLGQTTSPPIHRNGASLGPPCRDKPLLSFVCRYYYYFLRVIGRDVWWKRYVTKFQIIQFCTSAACGCVTSSSSPGRARNARVSGRFS